MTMPMVHRNIDPYEKSIYILVCSLATEANLTGIKTDLSCAPSFTMRYDWMYSSHVYSGSP